MWFQNRRARWRKREIKNKPAPVLQTPQDQLLSCTTADMFQPPSASAIFPPLNSVPFTPWGQLYPLSTSTPLFPPRGGPGFFHRHTSVPVLSQAPQTVNVMLHPRVSSSTGPSGALPASNLSTRCQAYSNNLEIRHSEDDYLAAVTLASGFLREN